MKKNKKAIICGTGSFGELAQFYLENDSQYEVVAFCESNPKVESSCGLPLVAFNDVENLYAPHDYEMFVAIGYRQMNSLRKDFCEQARVKGYKLLSYVSSKATYWDKANKIGDNVFIFEDNTIQPFVEIGDGTIIWSGNHIGHHSKIGKYCFISSHVVISGFCEIGEQSFLGVNATITDSVKVADSNLIGAHVLITKNTQNSEVYAAEKGKMINSNSRRFL